MYFQNTSQSARGGRRTAIFVLVAFAGLLGLAAMQAPKASAELKYPYEFMPFIDSVSYQGQSSCVPAGTHQPGVIGFRDLINFWFGVHESQDWRACGQGAQSEHKESRALDYFVNARTDPATTVRILGWLLETDQYGNRYARARRLGVMYIISNGRMFRLYDPGRGWTQYHDCVPNDSRETECHVNHIHFSFTWPGARKQTTWWTTITDLKTGCQSRIRTWHFVTGFGVLIQIKAIRDGYGHLYDTQSEIANSPWRVESSGNTYRANQPVSPAGRPVAKVPAFVTGGWCRVAL